MNTSALMDGRPDWDEHVAALLNVLGPCHEL